MRSTSTSASSRPQAGLDDSFAEDRVLRPAERRTDADAGWQGEEDRRPRMLGEARLWRALEFMSADLSAQPGLENMAQEAGIDLFHFARMFRQAMGAPPRAFLNDLRLEVTRSMLERSDPPVADMARLVTIRPFETPPRPS